MSCVKYVCVDFVQVPQPVLTAHPHIHPPDELRPLPLAVGVHRGDVPTDPPPVHHPHTLTMASSLSSKVSTPTPTHSWHSDGYIYSFQPHS